jgi:hypothetical protein
MEADSPSAGSGRAREFARLGASRSPKRGELTQRQGRANYARADNAASRRTVPNSSRPYLRAGFTFVMSLSAIVSRTDEMCDVPGHPARAGRGSLRCGLAVRRASARVGEMGIYRGAGTPPRLWR